MAAEHTDVVRTARQILRDEGLTALSLQRVATQLGTSRQALTIQLGGTDGLLRALHDAGFASLTEALATAHDTATAAGDDDPREAAERQLTALAAAYRQLAQDEPGLFELMLGWSTTSFADDAAAHRLATGAFAPMVRATRAWLEATDQDPTPALSLARSVWASIHGLVLLELAGHVNPDTAPVALEQLVLRVLGGSR